MEGAAVSLALLVMAGALGISAAIRSQFSTGVQILNQRVVLHTQLHEAFDNSVLNFWRYYGSGNADLLTGYRSSEAELRALTKRSAESAPRGADREELVVLATREEDFFDVADRLAAGPQIEENDRVSLDEITKREVRVRNIFHEIEQRQFSNLNVETHRLAEYTNWLRVSLLMLGAFPILVMLWFQRALGKGIWMPLEKLHGMVLEVKRGNLDVRGDVPDTVELGTLTAGFLSMASELRDIRNSLEEKVKQRAAQLEEAHKDLLRAAKLASLGQLVSGVAHEINNPLTSILGFTEVVLGRPALDASVRTQLQTVRKEALRLKSLVGNLSRMSRRRPEQLHRMDLRTVPARMLSLRTYQLAANNVDVQYTEAKKPIWVKGDGELLLQAMLQLVLNAENSIRECRDKGEIRLKCDVWDGRARITVEDNGCGIPADIREHIFDPFFAGRPKWQGTGLGLSICHSIVEQHDGEVGVESEVGRGTTIRVLLPLGATEDLRGEHVGTDLRAVEPLESAATGEEPGAASPARRFLVIDDEMEILNLVSVVLGKTGATVVVLQDPTRLDAILNSTSNNERFDAVLCDLKMPGQDGLSVLRTLRRRHPELARKFLLMTGNLADADKEQIELEGVRILPKPFTLVRLREVVGEIVAN
ncbi:MAG TPA: ATP-binding protein [Candidatus Acidoferrales bacterium]|nr:ATP-binding protein [Candidatus Acidoferrales bacterium]